MKTEPASDEPDNEKQARLFVAIPLVPPLVKAIRELQLRLESAAGDNAVRWTLPEQLHLTLRFLGSVATDQIEECISRLHEACASLPRFQLQLGKPGCFPTRRDPRILWVGLEGQVDQLARVQQTVSPAFDGFGDHTEKKPFHPHLTIGRTKHGAAHAALGDALSEVSPPPLPWPVEAINLMQSHLLPQGARYVCLASVPLAGSST